MTGVQTCALPICSCAAVAALAADAWVLAADLEEAPPITALATIAVATPDISISPYG